MKYWNERNIFLLDGLGAAMSALATGLILPLFTAWTQLPPTICSALAVPGVIFAVYSLSCYSFVKRILPWMLLAIILANLAYCLLAVSTVLILDGVSVWGRAYFVGEAFIVVGVVMLEWKVYRAVFRKHSSAAA